MYRASEMPLGNIPGQTQDLAKVRLLNASPDMPAADVYVNDQLVVKGIKYKAFTSYADAKPGSYSLRIAPHGLNSEISVVEDIELFPGMIYTIAITGLNPDFSFEIIPDIKHDFDEGKAYMRFINLSPYTTEFNINMNKREIVDGLYYLEITDYFEFSPATYSMDLIDTDTEKTVLENPKVSLSGGKGYACYIIGLENARPSLEVLLPLEGASYIK